MADYSGILLIDKPADFTSFDVVAKLRGIAHTRKIGHAGTLDPMATGVLPLFFGRAAKACELLPRQDKCYEAVLRLGLTTDTQDITGRVISEHPVTVDKAAVYAAAAKFTGDIMQVPPMYSALKVNGQKLCDLARKGVEIERQARPITIYEASCEVLDEAAGEYRLRVHCSKGTYIRTLVHDIGQTLGCGAVLTALRRTMAAGFLIEDCLTIEAAAQATAQDKLAEHIQPIELAFSSLPAVELSEVQCRMFRNGVRLDHTRVEGCAPPDTMMRVHREDGLFLGLARVDADEFCQIKLFTLEG